MSGNMAYRGTVPPSFIRRYALVNVHTAADLVDACDYGPINISLYQARQKKYEPLIRLIFDGIPLPNYQMPPELSEADRRAAEAVIWDEERRQKIMSARTWGVQVVTLAA